eukprot:TRINITY_DN990_c0_g1_i4.p1 TRINITY_DN990_c0_g1~~TRINITY_DN990_c0_g1_i4.p1  ORF type:complete len:541 (+),score=153.39 TRINITY_DN990_c0_g1_i4:67-1623(+)
MAAAQPMGEHEVLSLEVRDWVARVLGHEFAEAEGPYEWVNELQSGELLIRLLQAFDPDLVKLSGGPSKVWRARNNIASFLKCIRKKLDIRDETSFTDGDLLPSDGSDDPAPKPFLVISCLYALCKVAYERYGVEPPQMLQAEQNIDQMPELTADQIDAIVNEDVEEDDGGDSDDGPMPPPPSDGPMPPPPSDGPMPPPPSDGPMPPPPSDGPMPPPPADSPPTSPIQRYKAKPGDKVDQVVSRHIRQMRPPAAAPEQPKKMQPRLVRVSQGRYVLMPEKKVIHVCLLRDSLLMVRVGGGWTDFDSYMAHVMKYKSLNPGGSALGRKLSVPKAVKSTAAAASPPVAAAAPAAAAADAPAVDEPTPPPAAPVPAAPAPAAPAPAAPPRPPGSIPVPAAADELFTSGLSQGSWNSAGSGKARQPTDGKAKRRGTVPPRKPAPKAAGAAGQPVRPRAKSSVQPAAGAPVRGATAAAAQKRPVRRTAAPPRRALSPARAAHATPAAQAASKPKPKPKLKPKPK